MKQAKLATLGLVVLGAMVAVPTAFAQQPTTSTQDATATTQEAGTATQTQDPASTQSGTPTQGAATPAQDAWSQGAATQDKTAQGSAAQDGSAHAGDTSHGAGMHSGSAGAATGASAPPADAARQVTWTDLDADKDGSLSRTEVTQLPSLSQVFEQADADADSKLTADEYKAYVAKNGKTGADTQD